MQWVKKEYFLCYLWWKGECVKPGNIADIPGCAGIDIEKYPVL